MQPLLLLLLVAGAAKANHQMRLTDAEIAAAQANYEAMSTEFKAELAATAASSRASLKNMFVEEVMERNAGRKRSVVELEAEEWLETIQQAKREVHKSMGIGNIEPIDDGLWQTDIILRQHEAEDIIVRHGGELPAHRKAARAKRSVLFFDADVTKRWVSPITYTFDKSIPDQATRDRINANIAKVTKAAPCLQFNFVANPNPNSYYMKFTNPKGAASLSQYSCGGSAFIGMMPPNAQDQTGIVGNSINIQCLMTYSDQCFIDTMILHEIFHSLGLGHEQCRGDRDKWVSINMNNVISGMQNNYAIDSNASYTPYGMGYNYASLMQYKPNTLGINNAQVMTAKVAPIAENTAKMGNNAPVCGAMPSDWTQLNRAYCANPAKMTPAVQFAFSNMKCYSDKSSCTAGLSQVSAATCPAGYSAAVPSTGSCFPCTGSACFSAQPGDDWVATAYRASINAAGTYSGCGGPFFAMKAAKCVNPAICGDSDTEVCGYGLLQGKTCTDATFAKACPKTCGIAPCPKV